MRVVAKRAWMIILAAKERKHRKAAFRIALISNNVFEERTDASSGNQKVSKEESVVDLQKRKR